MYLNLWRIVSLKVRARMNVAAMSLLINLHTGTFNVAVCIRQTLWDFLGEVFKTLWVSIKPSFEGFPFPTEIPWKRSMVLKWGGYPNWAKERCILKASLNYLPQLTAVSVRGYLVWSCRWSVIHHLVCNLCSCCVSNVSITSRHKKGTSHYHITHNFYTTSHIKIESALDAFAA